MNARFWIFVNGGPVKLTLRPGQTLRHYACERHEEGWSSEAQEWTFTTRDYKGAATPIVERVWATDGRDCDGRSGHSGQDECFLDELFHVEPYGIDDERVMWPNWQETRSEQYDQFAEMAGY